MLLITLGCISEQERRRLAKCTNNHELIEAFIKDESINVKKALTENSNLYEEELFKLTNDESWQVRAAIPNSPVITNRVLKKLVKDRYFDVKESAKKAIIRMIEDLQSLIT